MIEPRRLDVNGNSDQRIAPVDPRRSPIHSSDATKDPIVIVTIQRASNDFGFDRHADQVGTGNPHAENRCSKTTSSPVARGEDGSSATSRSMSAMAGLIMAVAIEVV